MAVPAVALVALLVAALFVVVQGQASVQPADGPGSLPDRIYPAPSRMLTLQQAPIGPVSMLYAQPVVNGQSSWIAIGAHTDEYRWVAPIIDASHGSVPVSLSGDGHVMAVGVTEQDARSCSVDVYDARVGTVRSIVPTAAPKGCQVAEVSVSPDGGVVLAQVWRVTQRHSNGYGSRSSWEAVNVSTGQWHRVDASGGDTFVGWMDADPVFESNAARFHKTQRLGLDPVALLSVDDQGAGLSGPFGRLRHLVSGVSSSSLSPDGRLLAAVVDPSPASSHTIEPRTLRVWDVRRNQLVREVPLGRNVDTSVLLVGWQNDSTPVLSQVPVAKGGDPASGPDGGLFAYPPDGPEQRLISAPRSTTFFSAVVAPDVLRLPVRAAAPPRDPWYDARLLGPRLGDALRTPVSLLLLVALAIGAWVLVLRYYNRRRLT